MLTNKDTNILECILEEIDSYIKKYRRCPTHIYLYPELYLDFVEAHKKIMHKIYVGYKMWENDIRYEEYTNQNPRIYAGMEVLYFPYENIGKGAILAWSDRNHPPTVRAATIYKKSSEGMYEIDTTRA